MKLVKVDQLPEDGRKFSSRPTREMLFQTMNSFMDQVWDIAKVEYDPTEYNSPSACQQALQNTIKSGRYKAKAVMRHGSIYLVKT